MKGSTDMAGSYIVMASYQGKHRETWKLDGVAPLITHPPQTSSTSLPVFIFNKK